MQTSASASKKENKSANMSHPITLADFFYGQARVHVLTLIICLCEKPKIMLTNIG